MSMCSLPTKHLIDAPRYNTGWGYGYGWWIAPDGSYSAEDCYYGQLIKVNPAQGIVTVFTGSTTEDFTPNEEHLVDQYIVQAVTSAGALPENPASTTTLNAQRLPPSKSLPRDPSHPYRR